MDDTGINTRPTVYDDLVATLRRSIGSGERPAGHFLGTEQELCRQNGISRVSVRRATDLLIREGLIERKAGKGLFVRGREPATRVIQVIVPDLRFEQCVQIAQGAQAAAAERGFQTQVYDSHNRMDHDIAVIQQLPSQAAEGAIILSWHHARFTEALVELKQQGFPFVLVDEHARDIDVDSVTADNHAGGIAIGNALVDHGHRKIGFIGNLSADTVRARLEGLRDAIGDRGLPFDRSRVIDLAVQPQGDWASRIAVCTRELFSRPDRPTAVVYSDDQVAAEAYLTLRAMGIRVPEDVSVVGFDDSPLCGWLSPQLSSVRQPSEAIGRVAIEMLLDTLQRPRTARKRDRIRRVLGVTWVPRGSVGPAASD